MSLTKSGVIDDGCTKSADIDGSSELLIACPMLYAIYIGPQF
jgi:hypothetical protein